MRCSIDLDCPGKREGFVQLNHSDNRHAYGVIPIPIGVVAADNDGPTVLLTAGNHGDEYEGIVILQRLFRDLDPSRIRGRIIIMPSLNLPAVRVYQRTSPLDGANMNRSFGAQDISGPTQEIAQFVEEQLIAQSDYAIDLHSGGKMCEFSPCGYIYAGGGRKRLQDKFNAAHLFGAKYTVVVEGSHGGALKMAKMCEYIVGTLWTIGPSFGMPRAGASKHPVRALDYSDEALDVESSLVEALVRMATVLQKTLGISGSSSSSAQLLCSTYGCLTTWCVQSESYHEERQS